MSGAGVEEGEEALALDRDRKKHGIGRPYSCNSMKGDDESVSVRCGVVGDRSFWTRCCLSINSHLPVSVLDKIGAFKVEQARAHMSANIGLVAVEA
jgi:hypothetical protein